MADGEPWLQTGQARPGARGFAVSRDSPHNVRSSRVRRLAAGTAAPDGHASSELKVRSYTSAPTPLQPPTGSPRRS
jgi:hypothetical protein